MALENQISISFANEELQLADTGIAALKSLFEGKCITLTAEQRQTYGRLGNRNANWVKKVVDYANNQPNLNPGYLNKEKMNKDYDARLALDPRFKQLDAVYDMLDDTLLILGYDVYQTALSYYKNIKLMAVQNVPGAKAICDNLSAQFPGCSVKKASDSSSE